MILAGAGLSSRLGHPARCCAGTVPGALKAFVRAVSAARPPLAAHATRAPGQFAMFPILSMDLRRGNLWVFPVRDLTDSLCIRVCWSKAVGTMNEAIISMACRVGMH